MVCVQSACVQDIRQREVLQICHRAKLGCVSQSGKRRLKQMRRKQVVFEDRQKGSILEKFCQLTQLCYDFNECAKR